MENRMKKKNFISEEETEARMPTEELDLYRSIMQNRIYQETIDLEIPQRNVGSSIPSGYLVDSYARTPDTTYQVSFDYSSFMYPSKYAKKDDGYYFYINAEWFMRVSCEGVIEFNVERFPNMSASQQAQSFLQALQTITHMEGKQLTFAF
jgi:hypothetical protein